MSLPKWRREHHHAWKGVKTGHEPATGKASYFDALPVPPLARRDRIDPRAASRDAVARKKAAA